jgi:carbamoyl-phosphate synthase large subunit
VAEVWIGVTGFYATDNPHPGLAVVRALRAADPSWRVMALVYDRQDTGAFATGLIDAHARLPYPAAGATATREALRAIRHRHPLDVLIPTIDVEQLLYASLRGALGRLGILMYMPGVAPIRAREKRRLPALGARAGVCVPPTTVLPSADAVRRASTRGAYPRIVKGALVDSAIVHSPEDFRVAAGELATRWGYPLLAQPLLAGEEYDVAVVARNGEIVSSAIMKKLGVTGKGTAWAGVTVDEPRLVAEARKLVRALRWTGALEVEFLKGPDGTLTCFEINPRFPSWIALAAEADGNLPATLVRLALGEPAEPVRAHAGRLFTRVVVEHVFPMNPLAAIDATPGVHEGLLPLSNGHCVPRHAAGVVAVTGLNAAENPSPGLTVARSLRAAPTPPRLVGLTHEVLATGAYVEELWDEIRLLPFPSREDGGYADALGAVCRETGADCLMPTLDIEVPIVSWLASALAKAGVATLVPSLDALAAVGKLALPSLRTPGLRLPRTRTLRGVGELESVAEELGVPFVVKGPVADARVVGTAEDARVAARRLAAMWGWPLLAQEFVEGEEYGIAAVADRRHRVRGSVVVRKDVRTGNGNTWGGTTVADRALARLADGFAEALGWVGPFELEVIRHPRRGPLLLEVNPRFPAWVYLSAGAGANLPWAAVRLARGERLGPLRTRPGTFYARMAWDAISPVDRMAVLAVEGRIGHAR